MKPRITEDGVLVCPNCGFDYLHHGRVEVFNRRCEDAEDGFHCTVWSSSADSDHNMRGNPSTRRDGVLIHIEECEGCECPPVALAIYQHKGQTFIQWVGENSGIS